MPLPTPHNPRLDTWCIAAAAAVAALLAPGVAAQSPQSRPAMSQDQLVELARDVEKEVAEIRGWKFKHPVKTEVRDEAQLRQFIEKRFFEEELGGGKLERLEAMLRMVGLIPAKCDLKKTFVDVLLNQIGGFYDPDTKMFYMLQRAGVDYGPLLNRTLIAHELTHALDDQYLDLDKLMKSREQTEDWGMTIGAVVEGSATELMTRYMMLAQKSGKYDSSDMGRVLNDEMVRSQSFIESPPYFSRLLASYVCGMFFVHRGDPLGIADEAGEKTVGENLRAIAKNPPLSTEQILHPEKYWNAKLRDLPVVVDDESTKPLWNDVPLRVIHSDTLGEMSCHLLASPADQTLNLFAAALPNYWTSDAAAGWGGDRFYLLADGSDGDKSGTQRATHGIWITLWDTKADRDEFIESYEAERPVASRRSVVFGDCGVAFLFGFDAPLANKIAAALRESPPRFTCDGKPWTLKAPPETR